MKFPKLHNHKGSKVNHRNLSTDNLAALDGCYGYNDIINKHNNEYV